MEHISIDLWAANLEARPPDLASWLAAVDRRLSDAAARGAHLLVLPELACTQWLSFAPADLPPRNTLGWLAEMGDEALRTLAGLSTRHGVSLLPGTIPQPMGSRDGAPVYTNRAWLMTPEGGLYHQDKLSLTPIEEQSESGLSTPGDRINIIDWRGLRVVIVICLDAEFTGLWARLGQLDVDLVLIPAKTDMITGYNRVFGCARARAIEMQTAVCAVGAVGAPLGQPLTDTGVGGAAAFLPCDVSLSLDGVYAALPAQAALAGTDPLLAVRDLPVGACRRIRNGGAEAEVHPSAWPAEHLEIVAP